MSNLKPAILREILDEVQTPKDSLHQAITSRRLAKQATQRKPKLHTRSRQRNIASTTTPLQPPKKSRFSGRSRSRSRSRSKPKSRSSSRSKK